MKQWWIRSEDNFEPAAGSDLSCAPVLSQDDLQGAGLLAGGKITIGEDPVPTLFRMMELQRRVCAEPKHPIGGHAVLTVVTEHTITQRVIHRFDDSLAGPLRAAAA